MTTTLNRGYPIPDPAQAIHPGTRDLAVAIDADIVHSDADLALSRYVSLSAAVTAISSSTSTLVINTPTTVSSNLTIPANVNLRFTRKGLITVNSSITLTIDGPIEAPEVQIFAGAGNVSWATNKKQGIHLAAWWGVVGDDSTDCTAILQKILNQCDADNFSMWLVLPLGKIRIAGALQDTSLSNSQIVLPKRTGDQLSIRICGAGSVTSLVGVAGTGGTTLKSTLSSGTGSMISCKTSGFQNMSQLNVWFQGVSCEMPANPTNSCLDLRYIKRLFMRDFRIWTGEAGNWTQPTTSTSWGLRTPMDNVVSDCAVESGVVSGFYNSIEANEDAYLNSVQEGPSIYGYTFASNHHPVLCGRIGSYFSLHTTRFTGGPATVEIKQLDIERSSELGKWYSKVNNVDDFSEATAGDAHGRIGFLMVDGTTASVTDQFKIAGTAGAAAKNLWIHNLYSNSRNYTYVDPTGSFNLANPAVFELNRKVATSADTDYALLIMGTEQSGTSNNIGIVAFINSALGVSEKRIAQIGVGTDGATNSGLMNFSTWNAGTLGIRLSIKKGGIAIPGLPVYANNAAAVTGGLTTGDLYRTGADPDQVCVVH